MIAAKGNQLQLLQIQFDSLLNDKSLLEKKLHIVSEVHMYVYIYIYIYICVCVCVYKKLLIYVCMYVCMYDYTGKEFHQ